MTFEERFPVIKGAWLDGDRLVYHRRESGYSRRFDADGVRLYQWSEDVALWEVRTCCGILLDYWTRTSDSRGRYTSLRRDHADAIARPCRRCFPESA